MARPAHYRFTSAPPWAAVEVERNGLAELLGTVYGTDWERPSLCAGWRIRDMAAQDAVRRPRHRHQGLKT